MWLVQGLAEMCYISHNATAIKLQLKEMDFSQNTWLGVKDNTDYRQIKYYY